MWLLKFEPTNWVLHKKVLVISLPRILRVKILMINPDPVIHPDHARHMVDVCVFRAGAITDWLCVSRQMFLIGS
jgi:hypothetical protein